MPTPEGVGVSWQCAASTHGQCQTAGCRCMCHYRIGAADPQKRELVQNDVMKVLTPPAGQEENGPAANAERKCPKCGKAAQNAVDRFCRVDGTKLIEPSVHCGGCGAKNGGSDAYCGNCGGPLAAEITLQGAKRRGKRVNGEANV